ncbi:MAG: TonB-dependent receptor [Gammaproteobacteria bacterium]
MGKHSKVAVAVAAVLTATMRMNQGQAQEAAAKPADTDGLQEVVVTGLRRSLKESMDTKRESFGVVDAINAEDIGKFPDTNLSEALQRITGISISRRDGEGSLVTARGFSSQYNMVTLNGRMMPGADAVSSGGDRSESSGGTTRSFNFANLAAESISAVDVYKTGRADIATGGIGATIDIKTDRPLLNDAPGFNANLGAKAVYDTTNRTGNNVTPELSGIFSFVNDNKSFGVSLSASDQRRDSGSTSADVNDWRIQSWVQPGQPGAMELDAGAPVKNAPAVGQLYWLPNDLRYHYSDKSRERKNGQLALQFKPIDTLLLTTDYTYAENHLQEYRGDQTLWFVRRASAVTFDTSQEVATPVMISEDTGVGKDHGFEQQYRDQTNTLRSAGFNADWKITDRFSMNLDAHDSTMKSLPTGSTGGTELTISIAGPVTRTQTFNYNSGLPIMSYTLDDSKGNNDGVFDEADLGTQPMRVFYQDQATEIQQGRLSGTLEFDNGRFNFGVETRAMEMNQKGSQAYFALGDWGIAHPGEIPANLVQAFNLAGEFNDFNTAGADTQGFKANAQALGQWAADKYGVNLVSSPDFDQNNTVKEDTKSAYFELALHGELGGMPTNILLGARYEKTDVKSRSNLLVPTAIRWLDNNDYMIDRATTTTPLFGEAHYNHLLPSFDFDVEVVKDVKARFSYSQTIARAQYDQLRASVTIPNPGGPTLTGIQATATEANPQLVPLESNNFDLSLEWYFDNNSYVSAGVFEKRVSNFIGTESVSEGQFGLRDATAGPRAQAAAAALAQRADYDGFNNETELFVMTAIMDNPQDFPTGAAAYDGTPDQATAVATKYDVTPNASDPLYSFLTQRPVNNKQAKIHGFEFAGQHFFGNSGFGILANYTIVRGDVGFNNNADPLGADQFALLGLSDSANVVLMYEKYGFSARLAYNWRDQYLSNTNRGSFRNPDYVEPYSQYDVSVSYNISNALTVSFEGLNLTGEDVRQHGRSPLQLWYLEEQGPRYQLGARYKFQK